MTPETHPPLAPLERARICRRLKRFTIGAGRGNSFAAAELLDVDRGLLLSALRCRRMRPSDAVLLDLDRRLTLHLEAHGLTERGTPRARAIRHALWKIEGEVSMLADMELTDAFEKTLARANALVERRG